MKCNGRHTRNKVGEQFYSCPNCNSCNSGDNPDSVGLLQTGEGAHPRCQDLHENDLLECASCGFIFNGVRMANYVKKSGKARDVEPCNPTPEDE